MLKAAANLNGDALKNVLQMIDLSGADGIYTEINDFANSHNHKGNRDINLLITRIRQNQRLGATELPGTCNAQSANTTTGPKGVRAIRPMMGAFTHIRTTPDDINKLESTLSSMDDACKQQLFKSDANIKVLQNSDNPALHRISSSITRP